jgi:dephospho-CoA kinase
VAKRCFNDADELAALNAIVHPAVGAEVLNRVMAHEATDDIVVADIPLLDKFRSALPLNAIVVVDAPVETQVERLVRFRGFDDADARARIANQSTREERLAMADRVIDNGGDESMLAPQVDDLWKWLQALP